MQALVLGAGIIGLSTAYALVKNGYQVTIIDQHGDVAQGATFANGAQLSYSYVAPLAGPGVISKIPRWLLDPNSPLRFTPRLKRADLCWNLRFLKACNANRSKQTTAELLQLAYLSRQHYHELFGLIEEFQDFDFSATGKLVIHRSQASMNSAIQQLSIQKRLGGLPQEALSRAECISKEPALAPIADQIIGGIFTESEEAADAFKVSLAFKKHLSQLGVKFLFNTPIKAFKTSRSKVEVQLQDQETLSADKIIVCLGAESTALLAPLGIHVPLAPLKGYSLTLTIEDEMMAPKVSITDFERKIVYARLGNRLRLAGMADLVGMDYTLDSSRIQTLIKEAQAVFAGAGDYQKAIPWTGLRPATPLGKPIIDKTAYQNLYLNIGHGALGFTLATGSAELLLAHTQQYEHPLHGLFDLTAAKA